MAYQTCPKHWSNEQTMLQYFDKIILPYVESVRERKWDSNATALVFMDNFKGQITDAVHIFHLIYSLLVMHLFSQELSVH